VSRLSVLSALMAMGVLLVAFLAPDLTILAALVSTAVAVLAIFTGPSPAQQGASGAHAAGGAAYEVLDKLGEGGAGEVFRARQRQLGRLVALKRIKPRQLSTDETERFRREARVLSALSNPHTINVFDAGIQREGSLFYVMELLDGLNLRQLIERDGPLPPARVIHILRQATLSLIEAHEKGLIHRDLNPSNLMVCRYGCEFDFVKVLDFGLVKLVSAKNEGESFDSITRAGEVPGAPAFTAPESISGAGAPSPVADLYALGAVGYYLLSGKYLFEAEGAVAMARAQLYEEPAPLSEVSTLEVPEDLEALIHRCIKKDPKERPQSAEELFDLLEALLLRFPWTRAQARTCWQSVPDVPDQHEPEPPLPSETSHEAPVLQASKA
jgi:eukaryotic-like serine/threonine-protein kinase